MAKRPKIDGVSGDITETRVWGEVKVTVNLGDYESTTISLGEARSCKKEKRARTKQAILDDCEELVVDKVMKVREAWQQKS